MKAHVASVVVIIMLDSPVTLITDLKVLPGMAPVVGSGVAVAHPHETLGTKDCKHKQYSSVNAHMFDMGNTFTHSAADQVGHYEGTDEN